MDKPKPSVFIASSVEGLPVAEAIQANLEYSTHSSIWHNGTFKLSSVTLPDLVRRAATVDFAVFIFTPDDVATIRKQEAQVARDNVVFELGLFIGSIGLERCYVVRPRGIEMHLPSDLLGITPAEYDPNRPDKDIASALTFACTKIKAQITELGPFARTFVTSQGSKARVNANPPSYQLVDNDLLFLAQCVKSKVSEPQGLAFYSIENQLSASQHLVMMSALKLERMGYVEKTVESDREGYSEHFAYGATDDGVEAFLQHEPRYAAMLEEEARSRYSNDRSYGRSRPPAPAPSKSKSGFEDMDDDVPF